MMMVRTMVPPGNGWNVRAKLNGMGSIRHGQYIKDGRSEKENRNKVE